MFGKRKYIRQMESEARWVRSVFRSCKTKEQWDCANDVLRLWFAKWQRCKIPEYIDLCKFVDLDEIGRIKNRLIEFGYRVGTYNVEFEIKKKK